MCTRIVTSGIRVICGLLLLLSLTPATLPAQEANPAPADTLNNSIDFSPMSPLFRIYVLNYSYRITPSSDIFFGPYYANIKFKDIGNTDAPGFTVGYRQYIWKGVHLEYQLIPQWDHFYEENEKKTYPLGFDLWNEFRLGYTWNFELWSQPAFINFQWPFGFALYSDRSAKPESFKKHADKEPYFYFPPMFFLGIRF